MPTVNLTDRNVGTLPAPAAGRVEYFDKRTPGFALRVTEKDARSWCVFYRHKGDSRRMTLGSYRAQAGGAITLSLADAREMAKDILSRAAKGADPATEKKQARDAETVKDLAERFIAEYAKGDDPEPNKRSWKAWWNMLDKDVIKRFGNRKPADITRADIKDMLKEIKQRGSPRQSNRTLEVVRKMFNWAIEEEIAGIETNPCTHVKKLAKETSRDRVLDDEEIRTIWNALPGIDQTLADVYRLLFLTAARKGEVTEMLKPEISGAWWMLPGIRSKNARPHRVYLTEAARGILAARMSDTTDKSGRVFPSRGKTGLLFGVYDDHAELKMASGTKDWVLHDIRRTVASNLGKLGFSRFIQDRILNHVDKGVGSVYDLYSYDKEREQALTAWGKRLAEIVLGKPASSNVYELRAAGA